MIHFFTIYIYIYFMARRTMRMKMTKRRITKKRRKSGGNSWDRRASSMLKKQRANERAAELAKRNEEQGDPYAFPTKKSSSYIEVSATPRGASGQYGFAGQELVELGEHGLVRDSLRKEKPTEEARKSYMSSSERKRKQALRKVGNRKYFG